MQQLQNVGCNNSGKLAATILEEQVEEEEEEYTWLVGSDYGTTTRDGGGATADHLIKPYMLIKSL